MASHWYRGFRQTILTTLWFIALSGPHSGAAHPISADEASSPYEFSADYRTGDRFMGVRLLGAVALRRVTIDGRRMEELSALAWDQDEKILYAISDSGRLFHLRPRFDNGVLAGAAALAGYSLRNANGSPLEGVEADSEGLALENARNGVIGDSVLVAAFERRPRLARYTPKGRLIGELPLPERLATVANYVSANKSLESVTYHPEFDWLTAPERAMVGEDPASIRIWNQRGESWRYPLRAVPNNSLVSMEVLPDGSLVTLERGHGLLYLPVIISIRRVRLSAPNTPTPLTVSTLAVFDSSRGWRVDNFEGMTWLNGLKFLLVSDDNENAMQSTLLLQVELSDTFPRDYPVPEYDAIQTNGR